MKIIDTNPFFSQQSFLPSLAAALSVSEIYQLICSRHHELSLDITSVQFNELHIMKLITKWKRILELAKCANTLLFSPQKTRKRQREYLILSNEAMVH